MQQLEKLPVVKRLRVRWLSGSDENDEQTFDSLRQQVFIVAAAFKQVDNSRSDRNCVM